MIAALVLNCATSGWNAWLGNSLEHIRRDMKRFQFPKLSVESLREVPLVEVAHMEDFSRGLEHMREITRGFSPEFLESFDPPHGSAFNLGPFDPSSARVS